MSVRRQQLQRGIERTAKLCVVAVFLFFFSASSVHAQALNLGVTDFGSQTSLGGGDLRGIIANIVNIGLGFLGILAVLIMLYGGFLWMTSGGEEKKITKARQTIVQGVIGLVIILSSWGIALFILNSLAQATTGQPLEGGTGTTTTNFLDGELGSGIIKEIYPGRGAQGVPRNTRIMVTFKEAVDPATVIDGTSGMKTSSVQIKPVGGTALLKDDVTVTKSADNTFFTFWPNASLGNSATPTDYTVTLTTSIQKAAGGAALRRDFAWTFNVSTVLDLTPPKLVSIFPADGAVKVPRNALVQLTFDEAIDPLSASVLGAIDVRNTTASLSVAGLVKVSNGYHTIEFIPSEPCGVTNSCGLTVFCLPKGDGTTPDIEVKVKAASLSAAPPAAARTSSGVVDGVTDAVGNSFDGSGDGVAKGSPDDDKTIDFATSDEIRISPPTLVSVSPTAAAQGVQYGVPVKLEFSPFMSPSTLTSDNIKLHSSVAVPNYWVSSDNVPGSAGADGHTIATVSHDAFAENASYQPEILSGLKDAYQNCFTPIVGPGCTTTPQKQYCCVTATGTVQPQAGACGAP